MHFRGTFHQWKYKESGVKLKSMVWKEKRQKAALLWTSILVEFSKQKQKKKHDLDVALSCYCELRLKPRPLIQFYFSLFYDLFCEGWYVRLCISRMASNFFFPAALGLTWIKYVLRLLICLRACVVCWNAHATWNPACQDVSYLWVFRICKVTWEKVSRRSRTECIITYLFHTGRSY